MSDPPWPVFVLSLPGCEARRAPLLAALAGLGIAVEVVLGVDGREGLPPAVEPEVDREAACRRLGRPMSDAEIACALSHQRIYALIAERGLPGAVVLEDDAVPRPGLAAFLAARGWRGADLTLLSHGTMRVLRWSRREILPGIATWEPLAGPHLTVGYAVSARGAAALRRAGQPLRGLADWPCDITRLGARVVHPRLVGHPPRGDGSSLIEPSRGPLLTARPPGQGPRRYGDLRGPRLRWRRLWSRRPPPEPAG
jgi:glycosyl transferase family 25